MAEKKYSKPLDKDEDEKDGAARYRLPFAICKQKGIAIQDWWTPRDAWEALRRGGHIDDVDEEYAKLRREQKKAQDAKRKEQRRKEDAARKAQAEDPEHSPDYSREHKAGEIAGVRAGKPMTFEEADGNKPNPYFSQKAEKGVLYGYTTNCQTCVVAYEARLRGYDVRALPNNRNGYIRDLSHDTTSAWIDPETGSKPLMRKRGNGERVRTFLESNIREGARYTLQFQYGGSRIGHIVSVERTEEGIRLYDPQSGEIVSGVKGVEGYLRGKKSLGLTRVDNMAFNPEMADHILKGAK